VICARGERVLVACAEGPKGELGGGPHRIEPSPTSRAAPVGGVRERQVAVGRWRQALRLEVLAEQVTCSVHRTEAEKRCELSSAGAPVEGDAVRVSARGSLASIANTNGKLSAASAAATPPWKNGFQLRTLVPGLGPYRPIPGVAWNEPAANSQGPWTIRTISERARKRTSSSPGSCS
jgi:hypothetical protein